MVAATFTQSHAPSSDELELDSFSDHWSSLDSLGVRLPDIRMHIIIYAWPGITKELQLRALSLMRQGPMNDLEMGLHPVPEWSTGLEKRGIYTLNAW